MSNQIVIDGFAIKELRCKNDNCRKLIGYENIKIGVFIHICPACQFKSVFNMEYKKVGKDFMIRLKDKFQT